MKLNSKAFELTRLGEKIIEVRLYDDKRKKIFPGDEIIFAKMSDINETIRTRVTAVMVYNSFRELYADFPSEMFGAKDWSTEELVEDIYRFYSRNEEEKYGVVGFKLKLI
jgi:ASC-1-like (ASCH) protein